MELPLKISSRHFLRRGGGGRQGEEMNFTEVDVGSVVLEMEAGGFRAKVGAVLVFAGLETLFSLVALQFDLENFDTVQPVLEVVAIGDDTSGVPLSRRFGGFVSFGRDQVVEGRS